jgi:hypothetical protein
MRWSEFSAQQRALVAVAHDQLVKPRVLLHSIVTSPALHAEIMMRGTVRLETRPGVQRRYAAAVAARLGWQPVPGEFTLFAVDIGDVT